MKQLLELHGSASSGDASTHYARRTGIKVTPAQVWAASSGGNFESRMARWVRSCTSPAS
jgi:hypothetical protein